MNILYLIPLILIGVSDKARKIIPNELVMIIFLLSILDIIFFKEVAMAERVVAVIAMLPLFFIWMQNSQIIGGGDVKLSIALGFAIGVYNMSKVLLIATIIAIATCVIKKEKRIELGFYMAISYAICVLISLFQ